MRPNTADLRGLTDIIGAMEDIAVHKKNTLLLGPPGIGKTMVARRIPTILPMLTEEQAEEQKQWRASLGLWPYCEDYSNPPFRAPHHTVSVSALVGASSQTHSRVGELALARHGVLFLDEVMEFRRNALVAIGREMPTDVIIIASENLCYCGYKGLTRYECRCTDDRIADYQRRIETIKELLNINNVLDIQELSLRDMRKSTATSETSKSIRKRVVEKRAAL